MAIVTGGARGIGKAIAAKLAREGVRVVIANTRPESAEQAVQELSALGLEIKSMIADVAIPEAAEALIAETIATWGRVDILVNNAGITRDNLIMRMKNDDWDAVINTNLKGTFNCIKAVSRPMVKARSGRIINITSVVGVSGNAGQANYVASKAGVIGLTKSAAREFASRNINVNAVAPGYIVTEMTDKLNNDAKSVFLSQIPMGRPGLPEEVASLVVFLASAEAAYITGQTIHVDGGMVMA